MLTIKGLLLTPDQDQRKSRPSILNISSLLCSEPDFPSCNNDIDYLERSQQQREKSHREPPKENIWQYQLNPFHNDQRQPFYGTRPYNDMIKNQPYRSNSISSNGSSICSPLSSKCGSSGDEEDVSMATLTTSPHVHRPLKTKRRRTSSEQLAILNDVFDRTFFPSTQLRMELARQLGMSPRTVQIWFQNKRQAMRSKQRTINTSESNTNNQDSMFE